MFRNWLFFGIFLLGLLILVVTVFTDLHPFFSVKPEHVILISVDTLRSDYLGCYGNPEVYTPNLDRLFQDSTQFETCISPMGRTNPAFASLHTGLYPLEHRVVSLFHELPEDQVTLAERLKKHGFRTVFFNSNIMLRPKSGLTQGFDEYQEPGASIEPEKRIIQGRNMKGQATIPDPNKKPRNPNWLSKVFKPKFDVESEVPSDRYAAEAISDAAIDYIRNLSDEENAFLWVHYMDPHWPYQPPFPWNQIHQTVEHGSIPDFAMTPMPEIKFNNSMKPFIREYYRNLYKGEVEFTDRQIGRLLQELHQQDMFDSSLILFVSDHGESLGKEDIFFCHGDVTYQDNLSVPFLIRLKGGMRPGLIGTRVLHLSEIMPIVLSFLGIETPSQPKPDMMKLMRNPKKQQNRQRSEYMFGWTGETSDKNPLSFVKGIKGRWRCIMTNRYKLIYIPHPVENRWELYDLLNDPGEQTNLSGTGLSIEDQLRLELLNRIKQDNFESVVNPQDQLSPDSLELEQLRNLGYVD